MVPLLCSYSAKAGQPYPWEEVSWLPREPVCLAVLCRPGLEKAICMVLWAPQPFMGSGWRCSALLVSPAQQVLRTFSITSPNCKRVCFHADGGLTKTLQQSLYRKEDSKLNNTWYSHTLGLWDIWMYLLFHVSPLLSVQLLAKAFAVLTAAAGLV